MAYSEEDNEHFDEGVIELEPIVPEENRTFEGDAIPNTQIDVQDYLRCEDSVKIRRRNTMRRNKRQKYFKTPEEFNEALWAQVRFVKANPIIMHKGQKTPTQVPDVMTDEMFCIFCGISSRVFHGWAYGSVPEGDDWLEDCVHMAKDVFKDQRLRGAGRGQFNSTVITRFDKISDTVSVKSELEINMSPITDILKKLDQKLDYDANTAFQHDQAIDATILHDEEGDPFGGDKDIKQIEDKENASE